MINDYSSYWVYFPLILGVIAVFIALLHSYKQHGRDTIIREIKRNTMRIKAIAEVLAMNKEALNDDIRRTFEHSKGFIIKSLKSIEHSAYIDKKHLFKTDEEKLDLENIYKSFSVVADVLAFAECVDTEEELQKFMQNFQTAGNMALHMSNKVLKQGDSK